MQLEQDVMIMPMDAREAGDQHEEEGDITQEAAYGAPPSVCAAYT